MDGYDPSEAPKIGHADCCGIQVPIMFPQLVVAPDCLNNLLEQSGADG